MHSISLSGSSTRFGWGGTDANGQKRALPQPTDYQLQLSPDDLVNQNAGKLNMTCSASLARQVFERVFRPSLDKPGFVVISGLGKLTGFDMTRVRAFQVSLSEQLGKLRSDALGIAQTSPFSLKYLGRSNKAKKNPMHHDTQSTDAFVAMLYEPPKNIRACPFFSDVSQYVTDHKLDHEQEVLAKHTNTTTDGTGYKVKTHYGHQIDPKHQEALLADYTIDLTTLDPSDIQLVVFNDSVGLSKLGLTHGMRQMTIPEPTQPSERYFNHVVCDVAACELQRTIPPSQLPRYFKKGQVETPDNRVSLDSAVQDYINSGTIYYRSSL